MSRPRGLLLPALLACGAGSAHAHSPIAGVGLFYSGMLHPMLVPAHLIALIAMGLWLGQQRPASGRALVALVLAVPLGMALGAVTGWQTTDLSILAPAAGVAVAVALARQVHWAWRALVGAVLGGLLGLDSLPDGLSGRALWLSLGGAWLAILLAPAWLMAVTDLARRPWMKIGVRVLASWLAAASMLVLALNAFGPGAKPAAADAKPASASAR